MTAQDLKEGTLVLTIRNELGVITGYDSQSFKYPHLYQLKAGGSTYKASPDFFKGVLGTVDLAAFRSLSGVGYAPPLSGKTGTDIDLLVPLILKGIKIGDPIEVLYRGIPTKAIYRGYFRSRPRFPLAFSIDGKDWKGPLSLLVPKADGPAAKRDEQAIIKDIDSVYCSLSPENLTCDGELSAVQVRLKERQLRGDLKRLFAELGREVSESEVFEKLRGVKP